MQASSFRAFLPAEYPPGVKGRILAQRVTFIPAMTPPITNSLASDQLISVSAAAGRLDISLRSLYRLIADKQLPPPLKVGGSSKLCEADVAEYVQRLKSQRRV